MAENASTVVAAYFDSWKAKDFDTFQSLLADDVSFTGPFATLDNAEDCRNGIEGMSQITTDIAIRKTFVDGPDVLTWFDLHTKSAPPCPTANWSHVENGKITTIRVTFDPRPIIAASGS